MVQESEKCHGGLAALRMSPYWTLIRDLVLILIIQCVGIIVMANRRLLDQLLSPGGTVSGAEILLALVFLCVRMFLITFGPGWILARIYWIWSMPPKIDSAAETHAN